MTEKIIPVNFEMVRGPELKMWLAIRTDLGMSPGKIAVQAAHAASDLLLRGQGKQQAVLAEYLRGPTTKIAVRVDSETTLRRVASEAQAANIPWRIVSDAGRSEIAPGTLTVCAFGPAYRADLPSMLKRLQLFEA